MQLIPLFLPIGPGFFQMSWQSWRFHQVCYFPTLNSCEVFYYICRVVNLIVLQIGFSACILWSIKVICRAWSSKRYGRNKTGSMETSQRQPYMDSEPGPSQQKSPTEDKQTCKSQSPFPRMSEATGQDSKVRLDTLSTVRQFLGICSMPSAATR